MIAIDRARYALLYGPTTGDRIRLADTDLIVEVTEDLCRPRGAAGDEAVFGRGKVVRESMGLATATRAEGAPDTVITGAVIVDHWGVVKADVGIRDGRIVGIGKAGNPDTMDGVHPDLVIGPSTEIISGNGRILTAGAVDCHVHLVAPQQFAEALASGVTTMIGGGTGPADGTKAAGATSGAWHLARMLEALDDIPLNFVLLGKGNTVSEESLWEQLRAGAGGFAVHADWGSTPAAIDTSLRVADAAGVQIALNGDTLGELGFVDSTLAAIGDRTVHAYHTRIAADGRASDAVTVVSMPNILPSSTNSTRPHTVNTAEEYVGITSDASPFEDGSGTVPPPDSSAVAAEDVLHDLGAISMIGSDSQTTGRVGETIMRTWQTAHVNKLRCGALDGDGASDNLRARRYIAKYTICPAVAYGVDAEVGSVSVGKLADLVLWDPAFFGVRPHTVLKGGAIAYAALGDANAALPTPQPVLPRPMFGAAPRAAAATSVHFVAQAALEDDLRARLNVRRTLAPLADVRSRAKSAMPLNNATPLIEHSYENATLTLRINGEKIEPRPAGILPMAQRYFLF